MPVVRLDDGTGETIRILDIDGYHVPKFEKVESQEEVFRSIPNWKLRDDDVFICAYPKSGTHWLWEVTSMLMNQSADRVRLIKETSMLEGITEQTFDNVASPRALNTHLPIRFMPKEVMHSKHKIIFVQRNPKDVCVSFYHHHFKVISYDYHGKFENYFHRFFKGLVDYGSWFDYTLEWEQLIKDNPDHPIHVMSYEDMKSNSIMEISKLSEFLGLKTDPSLIEKISNKCQFHHMKKEKDPLERNSMWKEGTPGMYRKGQIGDWKNYLTVANDEEFDAFFKEKMKNSTFKYRFS